MIGGAGVDTASYATAYEAVDARLLGAGYAGDALGDSYAGVENLVGSGFGDVPVRQRGRQYLPAGRGATTSTARTGNDVLRGGRQADVLVGGLGADVFDFDTVANPRRATATSSGPGRLRPRLRGCRLSGGDRIDLSGIDANTTKGGNQAFLFGGPGIGRVSVVNSGANSLIRCNVDKDAAFELELVIEDGRRPRLRLPGGRPHPLILHPEDRFDPLAWRRTQRRRLHCAPAPGSQGQAGAHRFVDGQIGEVNAETADPEPTREANNLGSYQSRRLSVTGPPPAAAMRAAAGRSGSLATAM